MRWTTPEASINSSSHGWLNILMMRTLGLSISACQKNIVFQSEGGSDAEASDSAMPELSRFFGIVIRMFYSDHEPAHFHAIYSEYEALIEIETLLVFRGSLPRRALALVLEWAAMHRSELHDDWQRARTGQTLNEIEPLD